VSEFNHYLTIHVGDYLVQTAHLTNEQKGMYLTLQLHYWKSGELPDDDHQLAQIAGVNAKRWKAIGAAVKAFFTSSNCQNDHDKDNRHRGKLFHIMLDSQKSRVAAVSAARKTAGNKGLEKRYGQQLPQQKPDIATPNAIANSLPPTTLEEEGVSSYKETPPSSCALPERDERFESARALAARPTAETSKPPPEEPRQPPTEEQIAAVAEIVKGIAGYTPRPVDPVRSREEQLEILRAHSIQPSSHQDRAIPAIRKPGLNGSGESH